MNRFANCFRLLSCSLLAFACAAPAAFAQGTHYDALFFSSRANRLADIPKLADAGFRMFSSSFTPDDQPALKLCQDRGLAVVYSPNSGTNAQHKANFDAFPCIKFWSVGDDLNVTTTPDAVKASIAAMKPFLRADMKTFGTVGKSAKPEVWANVTDAVHLQLYIYKEGTLRKWYWDYVLAWRAQHKGLLWIGPYFGKSYAAFPTTDPVWNDEVFTPIAYNEAAIWLGLCAGADDWLGYSAYAISNTYPAFNWRLTDRWELLPGYAELFREIHTYDRFFAGGKRETFDNGRVVGATWTLPSGEALRVEVDTFETKPKAVPRVIPAPAQPATVTVKITSDGKAISLDRLP